ncbi:hypothetical protein CIB48_g7225 [Xylaria polymorpha]|nr:hypothetical protein CIB48_g7225 [Xylaria polymorpha]
MTAHSDDMTDVPQLRKCTITFCEFRPKFSISPARYNFSPDSLKVLQVTNEHDHFIVPLADLVGVFPHLMLLTICRPPLEVAGASRTAEENFLLISVLQHTSGHQEQYVSTYSLVRSPAMGLGMIKYRNNGDAVPFGQAREAFAIPNPIPVAFLISSEGDSASPQLVPSAILDMRENVDRAESTMRDAGE